VQPWVENFGPLSVPLAASKDVLFLGELPDLSSLMWYSLGSVVVFTIGWKIYGLASRGFADVV
jgi:ABC-type polysaccharide/polyol phosphate export permease